MTVEADSYDVSMPELEHAQFTHPARGPVEIGGDDLLLYFRCDEGSGGVFGDNAGTGRTCALTSVTWDADEFFGYPCAVFDGTTSTGAVSGTWDLVPPFSYVGWYKLRTEHISDHDLFAFSASGQQQGTVQLGSRSNGPWAGVNPGAEGNPEHYNLVEAEVTSTLDQWIMIALTHSDTEARLYKNKTLVDSHSSFQYVNAVTSPILHIGSAGTGFRFLDAFVAELSVYSRALTQSELIALYNGIPRTPRLQ